MVHPFDDRRSLRGAPWSQRGPRRSRPRPRGSTESVRDPPDPGRGGGGHRRPAGRRRSAGGDRHRPRRRRPPARGPGRAVRRLAGRRGSTGTTSRPRRSRPGRRRCSRRPRGGRARRCSSTTRSSALGRARPGTWSTGCRAAGRRRASPARPARPAPRTCSPSVLAAAGPTVAPAGLVQQRARAAADRAAGRRRPPATWWPRWAPGHPGNIAYLCRITPPRRRRGAQRRRRARRGVRLAARSPPATKARAGRGAARRRAWPCSTPTTRGSPRWPAGPRPASCAFGRCRRRRRAGGRRPARRRGPRRGSACVTPGGERRCRAAPARRAPRRQRAGRRGGRRSRSAWTSAARGRAAAAGASRRAAGGWRCTTRADGVTVVNDAYNANPDSVRAGAAGRWPRMGRRGDGRAAHLGGARRDARARRRARVAEHDAVGRRRPPSSGSAGVVAVGEGAAPVDAARAGGRGATRRLGPGRRRGRSTCCATGCGPGTSSSSRRPARSDSTVGRGRPAADRPRGRLHGQEAMA